MKKGSQKPNGNAGRRNSSVSERKGWDRRTFVKLIPALGAASSAVPYLNTTPVFAQTPAPSAAATPQQQQAAPRITKEMLRAAEQLFGIELTDAQKEMALQNVNTNLERYETLSKIDVPLDTEPATLFRPALPGRKFDSPLLHYESFLSRKPQLLSTILLAMGVSVSSRGRSRRSQATGPTRSQLAVYSCSRVHSRAARSDLAHARDGCADVEMGRVC